MRPHKSRLSKNGNEANVFSNFQVLWCTKEYDKDYLDILMQREKNRMEFQFQSPQISERKRLVDWMKEIAAKRGLDNFSIHLAVYLLDVFMDNYKIVEVKLELIALVSLMLATKFEERECNVLKIIELNELVDDKYSINDFHGLEVLILQHLNWTLLLPTVVHFVQNYVEFLFCDDDVIEDGLGKFAEARNVVQSYLNYVMDDVRLMHDKPSKVAAAIIAQTRVILRFVKIWPRKLTEVTGYKYIELKPIILRLKQMNKKNNNETE